MGEFFKGWRRQLGCVMLLLACVLMVRWISGPSALDTITIFSRNRSLTQLISRDATLSVRVLDSDLPMETTKGNADRFLVTTSAPDGRRPGKTATSIDEYTLSAVGLPYKWTLKVFGFRVGTARGELDLIRVSIWGAPYWSLVIPLTLLSACLLLSKPRLAKSKPEPK